MGWSFPIGIVKGTVIRIHVTFFLLLLWIGAVHHAQGGWDAAVEGVVFVSLLFLCVLLHEFGHVFAARRYGIQTPDITLLPIGGVARLERIPEEPRQELVVALAGPAVNFVIAGALYVVLGGFSPQDAEVQNAGVGILERVGIANLFIAVFNLIPAFPMDGGRILRAYLAHRRGYAKGTETAAKVGQAVAILLGVVGLLGNPILIFIAVFVWLGAASEAQAVQVREVSRGMAASDAAVTQFEALSPSATLEDAIECLIRTTQREFPVVDGAGRLRGVLTRDGLIKGLKEKGAAAPVLEAMQTGIPIVGPSRPLQQALEILRESRAPAVAVVGTDGRLEGLVTPENVGEIMMVRSALPDQGRGTAA